MEDLHDGLKAVGKALAGMDADYATLEVRSVDRDWINEHELQLQGIGGRIEREERKVTFMFHG